MSQSRLCPPRRARKVPAVPLRRGAAACPAPGPADSCQREHGASIPPARNPAEMGSHPEMGEMESYKVMLNGPAPWGFRLQGGKDFSMPLSISRLTPGGKAAQAGVGVGDWVLYIDGESTGTMTHIEAQNRIRACGDRLCLTLSRAQNHLGKPQKVQSLDKKPQEHPSSPKYDPSKLHLIEDSEDWQPRNTSTQSRSFLKLAQLTGTDSFEDHEDEPVRKPRGPRVSFWGTEEEWQSMHPPGTPACDPGKLRLMEDAEDWQPRTGTSQSRSFRKLARLTGTDGLEDHEDEPVRKPRDARGSFCGTEDQRQPPSHTEPPTAPACDPGKLRLMEDAEDWQPRTGTSQSRSFRKLARLTGTDGRFEDHEDEPVRKPRDARGSFSGVEEQWQPPPHVEPPTTPACDPGKLRLFEDAEDWQPRTGTSQSRSFRKLARLTGTDGLEDVFVKNPSRDARGSFCGTEEQRQPPPHTEPPTAPACDPGKLRLMEDAEDWQPRTGTSQSRSFRKLARLTGTDGLEDHEDEPVRKPRDARGSFCGTEDQRQPPSHTEPPTAPACDPGKLRLMEDAEDWQPRTGTSQSRSFRKLARLTGTDGRFEDHEDEPVRKPRDARGSFSGVEEQWQPPPHVEPPTTPACDPGKLRLFEDAEDWQPRTGTSQSRSFRKLARLTGTDGLEDVFVKNPSRDARGSFCGTEEQRQPPPHTEPPTAPACDPGKLRLMEDAEDWQPRTGTSQSRSFRKLARLTGTDGLEDHEDEPVRKPRSPQVLFCGTEEPRQPPQPLEPPTTPACDPGKLRLFEDAEDWQPRTGTSQSRSFRKLARLTGTDGLEDDDVFIKKPSQVSVPDPSPGAAMKTEPGLAPRTPAATPGPTSRPPWAVDPSFAERYAPDKTSTVLSKHSQPATPTPMQNRSSIVQAAQQAPEGPGRTPLCYKCNKIIRGRYLVALGHYYHPEEFTCCQCRKVLDEGGFFEEKGSIFCPKCYDTRYAPSCAKCKKKITGEVMHALKMTWHVQCFTCAACKTPIRNRAFYMEEGQPYCERDYEKMFGTKCRGCDFKIDAGDRFLEALGFSWHDTCFVCAICQTNLEGKTFYSKKDKPLCKSHAFSHV
ncbi:PDZ and LIM domain protein 7 isoform X6 [Gallus gallus]|uniref:PDZ and LIM domain protein 7 isoform X6 n=2 Tax=Gallus gallus TaxID=9031 RepID=UPI001F01EB9C|nr:PDZ and LIM domain protein 7 isoform X6 [Gallus gallus]